MLELVLGPSGSGKTTLLYQRIGQRARAGQKSILLVPEQFTSSTEGRIYRTLGDQYSGMVESLSFTSLAERVLNTCGGSATHTLTDAGRAVLVRRALADLGDNLKYYHRHRRSAAFCQMASETIDELKSAGLTGQQLCALAAHCGAGQEKLAELGLIFTAYESLLAQTGMDPSDRLSLAADRLDAAAAAGQLPDFLRDRAIFIDEFDTFNAPKKQVMAALLRTAPQVTVALCADNAHTMPGDLSLFSGAKRVALSLTALAGKNGVAVAAPVVLREDLRHRDAPGLAALAQLLAEEDCDACPAPEITLYAAPSREAEARAVAAAIARLVRQGAHYREMAVVCRDPGLYRAAARYEFRLAGIPLYCDETTDPAFSAPAAAVLALLQLCRGVDFSVNMTALAKTGLAGLTEAETCALENYVYTWSPVLAAWDEPFARSPRGFGESEGLTDEEQQNLDLAEQARRHLMEPVKKLRSQSKNATAQQLSRALYLCLKNLGAEECQQAQVEVLRRTEGIPAAEEAAREWNVMMNLLDQMSRLLGEENTGAQSYAELLTLLLHSSDLGHIPQSVDSVIFTSAGKMRLNDPAYVFVLGLAEGEFPCAPAESGLLTHADRDALMQQKIELPDCFENRMVREQVCFYKALTASSKGLWLSWPEGLGLVATAQLAEVLARLHPAAPQLKWTDYASTPAAALDAMGECWGSPEAASLAAALAADAAGRQKLDVLQRFAADAPRRVTDTAAMGAVLGQRLRISPSQLERYYTCRYGYFLQYVLGLRPRKKAQLTPDQSGTLMHWVLQMALEPDEARNPYAAWRPAPFAQLEDAQVEALAGRLVAEYARLYLPENTARFGYLLSRIVRSLTGLLCYLRDEQSQSSFAVDACEQRIGRGTGCLPPQVYRLQNGRTAQIIGTIDRVDQWVDEAGQQWVRVVDYKTGTKTFDLREVYCGLDCQMLLYLFALTRDESGRFTGAEPAGVLYLLADPPPPTGTRAEAAAPQEYKLDGLVRDREPVYRAMDAEATGKYLPFSFKDGKPNSRQMNKLADGGKLGRIAQHLDGLVTGMAEGLYNGDVAAEPLCSRGTPCDWCDYSFICRHEAGVNERPLDAPAKPFAEEKAGEEDAE